MDVSIIIVSWNVADLLRRCLRSIAQTSSTAFSSEVLVVDSASQDETVAVVREEFPWVTLLPQPENLGFTRCNNIGLAQARGRYLFLLNPDTELAPGSLLTLITYLEEHPDVGIIGPRTLNTDGTVQSSRRRFPTLIVGLFESTWLQPLSPPGLLDHYFVREAPDTAVTPVDWVQGSALLTRRQVYETIGGLDEGFVMYSEELDWCHRAKAAGWQVVYHGEAAITHHGGQSSGQATAFSHIQFQRSKLRYFRKHHGHWAAHLVQMVLALNYLAQIILESSKSLLGHKRQMRQARIQMYWQVLRHGLKVT